jgi:hypothetical protein
MIKQTFSSTTNAYRRNTLSHKMDYPSESFVKTRLTDDFALYGIGIANEVPMTVQMTDASMEDAWVSVVIID